MLKFRPISENDYKIAAPIMRRSGCNSTECSFPALLLWSKLYNTQICTEAESVYFKFVNGEDETYLLPFTTDMKEALSRLSGSVPQGNIFFSAITEGMKERVDEAFPNEFEYTEKRNHFDYIYKTESLATLSGKALHQKRNHVNKFMKRYEGRYGYEEVSAENIPEICEFQKEWVELSIARGNSESIRYESEMIIRLLDAFSALDLMGGAVRIDGKIRAYCLGTFSRSDTVDVMVEKGDYAYDGIYQYINKKFAEGLVGKAEFINREDDAGVEGLRKSKLSYNPEILLKKYGALWKR